MANTAKQAEAATNIPELHECDWATSEVIASIEEGACEAELIKQGKIKPQGTEEMLADIRNELGL